MALSVREEATGSTERLAGRLMISVWGHSFFTVKDGTGRLLFARTASARSSTPYGTDVGDIRGLKLS